MARWEIDSSAWRAAPACLTRMCSSARSPGPMHVAAAMLTPASEMATATSASAPGVFSTSMTRSTANPLPGGSLTEDDGPMTGATETEANRETIRRAFAAWGAGAAPITDVFAADMTWRVEGRSPVAGEYRNRQDFVDHVLGPFAARFAHSDDPFRPSVRALHADGDAVIVLFDGRGVTNEGEDYENVFVWFLRMRDGLVVDGTAVFDTVVSAALWRGGAGE